MCRLHTRCKPFTRISRTKLTSSIQSIGLLAAFITALEANPHVPHLYRNDTYFEELQCQAAHSPDFPSSLRRLVHKAAGSDAALVALALLICAAWRGYLSAATKI